MPVYHIIEPLFAIFENISQIGVRLAQLILTIDSEWEGWVIGTIQEKGREYSKYGFLK